MSDKGSKLPQVFDTPTEWARLMLLAIHRWLPGRPIVVVADGEFAALDLLHGLRGRMAVITRLRKDAWEVSKTWGSLLAHLGLISLADA